MGEAEIRGQRHSDAPSRRNRSRNNCPMSKPTRKRLRGDEANHREFRKPAGRIIDTAGPRCRVNRASKTRRAGTMCRTTNSQFFVPHSGAVGLSQPSCEDSAAARVIFVRRAPHQPRWPHPQPSAAIPSGGIADAHHCSDVSGKVLFGSAQRYACVTWRKLLTHPA